MTRQSGVEIDRRRLSHRLAVWCRRLPSGPEQRQVVGLSTKWMGFADLLL